MLQHMALDRKVKQEIIDQILLAPVDFTGQSDLLSVLCRVWPLGQMPSTDPRFKDAAGDIWQHMVNNNDWSLEELLVARLRVIDLDDPIFFQFLQA